MLRAGKAEAILVVKLARLTRSVKDLGDLVERYFASGKWALLSVSEQIDTRSAAGRLVLNVLASVAQWEREATGERTSAATPPLTAPARAKLWQLRGNPAEWPLLRDDAASDQDRVGARHHRDPRVDSFS